MKVIIQIEEKNKEWEEIPKKEIEFKNQDDLVVFAYRLAYITGKEVRIEQNFNGQYFRPEHAKSYLY